MLNRLSGKLFIVFLLMLSLLLAGSFVNGAEKTAGKSQRFITIDFENVDINLFIKYISELTGKNFIVDKTVKGNVTIVSPTKISEDEAYRVFESVLDVNGYTTVEAGAVIKIIPSVKARSENVRTFRSDIADHPEDKIVTQLIPLKHTTPDEIKKVLAPLVSKTSVVIAHTQSGMLIVTETLSNIQRLIAIIDAIDVPYAGEDIVVLPLEYASASTVSKVLSTLFQKARTSKKGARQTSTIKIVPYDRINALIVVATPADVERVNKLVKVLDSEMKKDSGNIHVFYLQHGNAVEMAKVLNFLPGQQAEKDAKGKAPTISKAVKVMADEETNSLIITATKAEYNVLRDVIKKLDIPRRMVYLEALIMDVSTTRDFEVGVQWAGGATFSDNTGVVAGGFSGSGTYPLLSGMGEGSPPSNANFPGMTFGVIKQGIQIGGLTFPNIGAVLRAYKNDSDINIVSTPQILTTDNKEAKISVGQNVPYITSQNTTAAEQDYTNFEYRDVATVLTITPQINQAETLRMDIGVEVTRILDNTDNTPTTFKRTANTTVIVKDADTVVIGGIIGQDFTETTSGVPFLADIPILGRLFRVDGERKEQTNMFIFITPRIIKNPVDLAKVTLQKETQVKEVMPEVKDTIYREVNAGHAIRLVEIAYKRMSNGEYKEAKQYLVDALEIDPENPYALFNLGVIFEDEGKFEEAAGNYQRLILSGSSATVLKSTDPEKEGVLLVQLARERLEKLRKLGEGQQNVFEGENEQ